MMMIIEEKLELDYDELAGHLGRMVENIAINYLKANHIDIVKEIYPDQSDMISIQIMKAVPFVSKGQRIGTILGKKSKRVVHGWNGDLVFILNDIDQGKRAIIFEIKFGRVHLSDSQIRFFNRVYNIKIKEVLMPKLKDIKVMIVHCHSLDMDDNQIDIIIREYKADYSTLRKPIEKPSESANLVRPVAKKRVNSYKRKKPGAKYKTVKVKSHTRKKRSGDYWK